MLNLVLALINRFKEPSSWAATAAGIAVVLHLPTEVAPGIGYILAGLAVLLGVLIPEKLKK